ncbi:nucleoporin SONB [Blastomyces dermatitidis ATCC 18188]|uniref:Nucleoporin SONB n=1 Tax=Ajellomyces dermatitidis (strain ATCC 18188 / CBS 674.68) TaxID=653446 RepID=F2TUE4_AJEDA|nr:nucleoporin SONB [Blastomyces dermatitidis ATCC 18188]
MAFNTGSSFGGFGTGNQQQGTGFGSGTGFGGSSTGTGFGTTSSPFGGTGNTGSAFGSTSGGFGSGGGFGTNTAQSNPMFGSQNKGFGAGTTTTGGNLFGASSTPSTTFGGSGFGSGGTGFGGTATGTTGTGVFGSTQQQPQQTGFGSAGQGSSMFGGTATGGTAFGQAGSAFGASGTALSGAVPPAEGTANPPFSAYTEKDQGSSITSHYQTISAMAPYSKYSFEELRVADYQHGRRYGTTTGQTGFGSSAFGGFGQQQQQPPTTGAFGASTTTTPFGAAATTAPTGFGQTQTTGFGTGTSNPLFGASKPATSLFGAATTSQPSGFGTTATTGGFGSTSNLSGATLFGSGTQQNRPAFGGTGSAFGGFGQQGTTTTSASPFGGTTATAPAFGQQQGQQQTTGTGFGFGQTQAQTPSKPLFGGFGGTTTQQQQPSTNPFGGATTGTSGLFGQTAQQQPQQGTSLFGNTANQQTGTTSLFGGGNQQQQQQEQKPSLFGNLNAGQTTTGTTPFSGFGAQNTQQAGTSLFGSQAQQQQKPSLFGGPTTQPAFGQTANATGGGTSLFNLGGAGQPQQQQQQQPVGGFGSSLLNPSQQPQQQQATGLQASLLDGNPYGSQSIFSGLPPPNAPSPGPLATPLSATIRQKQRTPLPVYKISPSAANRLITPPTRQGYGFSYSTYGTPSSSYSTPSALSSSLLGGSLRGGSLGRSFNKSMSTSNLRKTFDGSTDSILSPGAFSAGTSRYSNANLKRLTIDRSLRTDLFSRSTQSPSLTNGEDQGSSKLKKKVSFDSQTTGGDSGAEADGSVVRVETESPEPTAEELGFLRSSRKQPAGVNGTNGTVKDVNGVNGAASNVPEMEQVRGNELSIVPEGREQDGAAVSPPGEVPAKAPGGDPKPGEYWMKPTRSELSKLPREQQKRFVGFTVGRAGCGSVTFDEPVDLTTVDLDSLFDKFIKIGTRSITVYPDDVTKPPRGKGLNVPSTLRIENSWPRGRDKKAPSHMTSGPTFDRHVERLKRVTNTEFIAYEKLTGTWVFKVPHFTTYGLDYDDDDDEGENFDQSTLSAPPPDTPTPKAQTQTPTQSSFANSEFDSTISLNESYMDDSTTGMEDDTFEFKKRKLVPGAFLGQGGNDGGMEDQAMDTDEEELDQDSFLDDDRSSASRSETGSLEQTNSQDGTELEGISEDDNELDVTMVGAFPAPDHSMEQMMHSSPLKPTTTFQRPDQQHGSPSQAHLDLGGNWAEQLQRTISPRKQNRQALREIQGNVFTDLNNEDGGSTPTKSTRPARETAGFATSIDLMNSLFPQAKSSGGQGRPHKDAKAKGFQWPYPKQSKTVGGNVKDMSENDIMFHNSFKPKFGCMDNLICPRIPGSIGRSEAPWNQAGALSSDGRTIVLHKYDQPTSPPSTLDEQKSRTNILVIDNVPFARLSKVDFSALADTVRDNSPAGDLERQVWQLANVLFNDDIHDDISAGVPKNLRHQYLHRIKKDRLSRLWQSIIRDRHSNEIANIESPEERAIAYLCSNRIDEACKTLVESRNLHLATLIPQIGRNSTVRRDMQEQIESWRKHNVYSEMTEPIRALYELLAGNCLRSDGKPGGALEDRASTFYLSERFELDWIQAFGLRLWYGIDEGASIEAAVELFHHDITHGNEPAYPFSAVSGDSSRDDPLESPLWVMLKSFTAVVGRQENRKIPPIHLPEAILPDALSGTPLRNRFSFQLFHHLQALMGHLDAAVINEARGDQLTWDYAWELAALEQFPSSIFVLEHLLNSSQRERSIKELLSRFAAWLPVRTFDDGTPNPLWNYIVGDLQVPTSWIWVAKALYARAQCDPSSEVQYLINAKHWNEAHETFRRLVGPRTVIERDYATLGTLLSGFGESPERKVRGWVTGGAIYDDFLHLITAKGARREPSRLKRLVSALAALGLKMESEKGRDMDKDENRDSPSSASVSLEETVAFREISHVVAGWCARDTRSTIEPSAILNLLLTQDTRLLHTAEMSRRYYNIIMATAH